MLKINMKDGSVLLLACRMHTVYPHGENGFPALLVAHFDEGSPEFVELESVHDICDLPFRTSLKSEEFWSS